MSSLDELLKANGERIAKRALLFQQQMLEDEASETWLAQRTPGAETKLIDEALRERIAKKSSKFDYSSFNLLSRSILCKAFGEELAHLLIELKLIKVKPTPSAINQAPDETELDQQAFEQLMVKDDDDFLASTSELELNQLSKRQLIIVLRRNQAIPRDSKAALRQREASYDIGSPRHRAMDSAGCFDAGR